MQPLFLFFPPPFILFPRGEKMNQFRFRYFCSFFFTFSLSLSVSYILPIYLILLEKTSKKILSLRAIPSTLFLRFAKTGNKNLISFTTIAAHRNWHVIHLAVPLPRSQAWALLIKKCTWNWARLIPAQRQFVRLIFFAAKQLNHRFIWNYRREKTKFPQLLTFFLFLLVGGGMRTGEKCCTTVITLYLRKLAGELRGWKGK